MVPVQDVSLWSRLRYRWLPTPGNVIFMLVVMITLIGAQNVGAIMLPAGLSSTTTIPYQGRLGDAVGTPLNGDFNMVFRIYNTPTNGSVLWSETYNGSNKISVSDGLFSVILGSQTPIPMSVITGNNLLYISLDVNGDGEMSPRTMLGSVPYAVLAQTVPDDAITTSKVLDANITFTKLADYAVTTSKVMTGAITADKLHPSVTLGLPAGSIVLWGDSIASIPSGWQICNGTNGTPDLRDRFIVGAGNTYAVDDTGGATQVTLALGQIPSHSHTGATNSAGGHSHQVRGKGDVGSGGDGLVIEYGAIDNKNGFIDSDGGHTHNFTTSNAGSSQAHENRPPYYGLAFICKQ